MATTAHCWREDLDALLAAVGRLAPAEDDGQTLMQRVISESRRAAALQTPGGGSQSEASNVKAFMARSIQLACRTASRAILEAADGCDEPDSGESSAIDGQEQRERVSPKERSQIDYVLGTLYYMNQAVQATTLCERLLREGARSCGMRAGRQNAQGKRPRGTKAGKKGPQAAEAIDERDTADGLGVRDEDLAAGLARFSSIDVNDTNRLQQLILFLLNCAQLQGYRRFDGAMYAAIVTEEGHSTHAWQRVMSMRDFVYEHTRKEMNFDMWLNLTSVRANVGSVVEHLCQCRDSQLPDLEKDRHAFAFRNGLYLASEDRFVAYGSAAAAKLPIDLVCAKFFDEPFVAPPDDSWADLKTPMLQSILDYQDMGDEVSRWMYVMIGRLIYDVNELDAWQVIPFLKGAASSGKSTVLTCVCRSLYEPCDVGVLSNNIERKFGLSAIYDKLIFIGPEIKGDLALEQAEFQSLVSGETVQVAVKNEVARCVDWRVPGILAGNEVPNWVDNSGSINRRVLLFEFPKQVHNGDMELGKKLQAEMPTIILKANRAYREAVRLHARSNLWNHLPTAFHNAKNDFTESINSLVHFLRSGALAIGDTCYMPLSDFTIAYRDHVERFGLVRLRSLTGDALKQPLLRENCRIGRKSETRVYPRGPGGRPLTTQFVIGCDLQAQSDLLGEAE